MTDISDLPTPVDIAFVKYEPSNRTYEKKLPIIIYHGLFGSKDDWNDLPKKLSEQAKRVVYICDIRDHGDSPWTDNFCYRGTISDMVHFMNKNKIEKADFIGHSLGGIIFSRFATLFPDLVRKVVLIDIHPKKKLSGKTKVTLFTRLLFEVIEKAKKEKLNLDQASKLVEELFAPHFGEERLRKAVQKNLILRNGEVSWRFNLKKITEFFMKMVSDGTDDIIPNSDRPFMEIYGSLSEEYVNEDDFESVLKMLPNTQFEKVEGANHSLQFTHPNEFLSKVVPFLDH